MKKNPDENFSSVEVDTITGEYYIKLPEWMVNDLSWYEDTEVRFTLDGNEIIMTENC
tara:strand:+ start:1030 stop:1200 length:171 start_codon:yes stop_codon:yes gene_type:complete